MTVAELTHLVRSPNGRQGLWSVVSDQLKTLTEGDRVSGARVEPIASHVNSCNSLDHMRILDATTTPPSLKARSSRLEHV